MSAMRYADEFKIEAVRQIVEDEPASWALAAGLAPSLPA